MILHSKFSLGDRVWRVARHSKSFVVTCPFCNGRGKITGVNSQERTCPDCYGEGQKTEWERMKHHADGPMTIGLVRVERWKNSSEEKYMMEETGIRSGSVYDAEDLFATEQEAERVCKERDLTVEKEEANAAKAG